MSAQLDKHYIDLSPDKCISIDSRHILLRHKSDNSYYQGRPINAIESILTDEIVFLRAELAALRATVAAQARQLEQAHRLLYECALHDRAGNGPFHDEVIAWLSTNAPETTREG